MTPRLWHVVLSSLRCRVSQICIRITSTLSFIRWGMSSLHVVYMHNFLVYHGHHSSVKRIIEGYAPPSLMATLHHQIGLIIMSVWHASKPNTEDAEQPTHELDVLSCHENDVNYVQFSGCAAEYKFSLADTSKEENLPKLTRENDGEGPDILQKANESGTSGHAESLAATLAEHQQNLVSFQVLINQLKEVNPAIQKSISKCNEKVNNISSSLPQMTRFHGRSTSPNNAQSSGRTLIEKVSTSPPTLKLPQLFSSTSNSSGKGGNIQKCHTLAFKTSLTENVIERNLVEQFTPNNHVNKPQQDNDYYLVQNLKLEK